MKQQQRIHADVITDGDREPLDVAVEALTAAGIGVKDAYGNGVGRVIEPNRERLIALAQWAAGEDAKRRLGLPNEWNQSHWFYRPTKWDDIIGDWVPDPTFDTGTACGTACCIAGKITVEDGGKPAFQGGESVAGAAILPNGQRVHVRDYAQQALGLDESQAMQLFEANNTLEDVLELVAEFIGAEDFERLDD